MPDIPSRGKASPQMDKKHLNNLPVLMGSAISVLAQTPEHKDLGFVPFATTKWVESDNQQS